MGTTVWGRIDKMKNTLDPVVAQRRDYLFFDGSFVVY
jgi:hypothetical protein